MYTGLFFSWFRSIWLILLLKTINKIVIFQITGVHGRAGENKPSNGKSSSTRSNNLRLKRTHARVSHLYIYIIFSTRLEFCFRPIRMHYRIILCSLIILFSSRISRNYVGLHVDFAWTILHTCIYIYNTNA